MSFTSGFSFSFGKGAGGAGELLASLLQVVHVEVAVASRPHEVSGFQFAGLGQHVRQEGIGGDVERDAEEDVRAALIELAR